MAPFETLVSCYAYVGLTTYGPFDNKCLSCFWVTFKSSNRLGEKRVLFLNSYQNSSFFEALWLLISILYFSKLKNIISWARNWFYLILVLPDKPFKWYTMPNPWLEIILWKSENAKMTQNCLSSPNCIFWLQSYRSFQKSSRKLRGIFYQMDHICWAHSMLKKSPRLKMRSQLSHILFHSFIVTLYTGSSMTHCCQKNLDQKKSV